MIEVEGERSRWFLKAGHPTPDLLTLQLQKQRLFAG